MPVMNPVPCRHTRRGIALPIVLILLFVFTLAALSGSQQLLTEQRISSNQLDRLRARQLAFIAMETAEYRTRQLDRLLAGLEDGTLFGGSGANGLFTSNCRNTDNPVGWVRGLCLDPGHKPELLAVEDRAAEENGKTLAILAPCNNSIEYVAQQGPTPCRNGNPLPSQELWANPRYVIELVDHRYRRETAPLARLYRITVRAWGSSRFTSITLQHYMPVTGKDTLKLLEPSQSGSREAVLSGEEAGI